MQCIPEKDLNTETLCQTSIVQYISWFQVPPAVIKYAITDVLYSEFQIRAGCAKKIPKNGTLFRNKIFDFIPILFQI